MKLKDVPVFPSYLVFHDGYDNGAMDVYPQQLSIELTQLKADLANIKLEESGNDEGGHWKAYTKLPRVRIYKFHAPIEVKL